MHVYVILELGGGGVVSFTPKKYTLNVDKLME